MRRPRVRFVVRQLAVAAAAVAVVFAALGLWPVPVRIEVRGVNGRSHGVVGRDAIFHCVVEQDDDGLRRLLAEGHDLRAPVFEANGWTFLHHAADRGTPEAVELLIASGADVNATVIGGPTPLQVARVRGRDDVVTILGRHGAR